MSMRIVPAIRVRGAVSMPGDKSISHRAVIIGSIAKGETFIQNLLASDDLAATGEALRELGVEIREEGKNAVSVKGRGLRGFKVPRRELFMRDSGTSMRVLLGLLVGQCFTSKLTAGRSLSKRPMRRVTEPLAAMGAGIEGRDGADLAPLTVRGGRLKGMHHRLPVASAQVKSALLLAGLYADGVTSVTEPFKSRDHTERMLALFGADISVDGLTVSVRSGRELAAQRLTVPGDISSAAFFIAAATIIPGSDLIIKDVGINNTRSGAVEILKRMGADVSISGERVEWEPRADLRVRSAKLRATTVRSDEIPRAIDEIPILMVAAAFAAGETVIKGASELRVKETDRINSMAANLRSAGVDIESAGGDIKIRGPASPRGGRFEAFGDHRTAMSMAVLSLAADGESELDDPASVTKSFPQFFDTLNSVISR